MKIDERLQPEKGLSWTTREYPHSHNEKDWYWAVIIIAGSITVASVFWGNIVFAVLVVVGTFALLLFATRAPDKIEVSITSSGISIGELFYPFKNLDAFNVWEYDDPPRLMLKSKKKLSPVISIEIEEVDPGEVGDYLAIFLDEDEELAESIFHKIMERLGF